MSLFFSCSYFRKPLPKIDSSTPGVNELDLKIQETRMMEKVLCLNTCRLYCINVNYSVTRVVYHLPRNSGFFGQNVNGTAILARPTRKFPK